MVAGQKTGRVKYLGPTKFAPGYAFYIFLRQSGSFFKLKVQISWPYFSLIIFLSDQTESLNQI